jgi:hypothetical protein
MMCMDDSRHIDSDQQPLSEDEMNIELVQWDNGLMLDEDCLLYIGLSVRCFEGAIIFRKDGSISLEYDNGDFAGRICDMASKIAYLLSLHIDLFGLIENGEALPLPSLPTDIK